MGKIEKFLIENGAYSICGAKIVYPQAITRVIDFEKNKKISATITLMLPRKDKNDWLDEFRLLVSVIMDTESEEANMVSYKLLADLKKEFNDLEIYRSAMPLMIVLFAVPASKENSFAIVEEAYTNLINILKKY